MSVIWIPLALAVVYFIWRLGQLASKGEKLDRQLNRLEKMRSEFESSRKTFNERPKNPGVPKLGQALQQRKNFLDRRSEKHRAKQRRLIKNLKSKERE